MAPSLVEFSRLDVMWSFSDPSQITQVIPAEAPGRLEEGLFLRERWRHTKELGRGNFGTVFLQQCLEPGKNRIRAVKEIRRQVHIDVNRELEAAILFSHHTFEKSFVKSFGWYETPTTICLTMEYMDNGDLERQLYGPLQEAEAQLITAQIVQGLAYMHKQGFAHRDLKPANVLVYQPGPNWWVKLTDFGFSKRAEASVSGLHSAVFSPAYAAPEILLPRNTPQYTNAVDIWSAGVISFVLLTGKLPFTWNQPEGRILRWPELPVYELYSQNTSETGCGFVQSLLSIKPFLRPTAKDCLSHMWLREQTGPWKTFWQYEEPPLPPRPGSQTGESLGDLFGVSNTWSKTGSNVPNGAHNTSPNPILQDNSFQVPYYATQNIHQRSPSQPTALHQTTNPGPWRETHLSGSDGRDPQAITPNLDPQYRPSLQVPDYAFEGVHKRPSSQPPPSHRTTAPGHWKDADFYQGSGSSVPGAFPENEEGMETGYDALNPSTSANRERAKGNSASDTGLQATTNSVRTNHESHSLPSVTIGERAMSTSALDPGDPTTFDGPPIRYDIVNSKASPPPKHAESFDSFKSGNPTPIYNASSRSNSRSPLSKRHDGSEMTPLSNSESQAAIERLQVHLDAVRLGISKDRGRAKSVGGVKPDYEARLRDLQPSCPTEQDSTARPNSYRSKSNEQTFSQATTVADPDQSQGESRSLRSLTPQAVSPCSPPEPSLKPSQHDIDNTLALVQDRPPRKFQDTDKESTPVPDLPPRKLRDSEDIIALTRSMPFRKSQDSDMKLKPVIVPTSEQIVTLSGHTKRIHSITFAPNGNFLVSTSEDATVKIWDPDTKYYNELFSGKAAVYHPVVSPNSQIVATRHMDVKSLTTVWDVEKIETRFTHQFESDSGESTLLAFSKDGSRLFVAGRQAIVRCLNSTSGETCKEIQHKSDSGLSTFALSGDGNTIATVLNNRDCKIWNAKTGALVSRLENSVNPNMEVDNWKGFRGAFAGIVRTLVEELRSPLSVAMTHDGQLVTRSGEKTVRVWKRSGKVLYTLDGHTANVRCLCFSPDGSILASASEDNTVRLWSMADGKLRQTLKHNGEVLYVQYSPNGRLLATAESGRVRLWDSISGLPLFNTIRTSLTGKQQLEDFAKDGIDRKETVAFCPNGEFFAWTNDTDVCFIRLQGQA